MSREIEHVEVCVICGLNHKASGVNIWHAHFGSSEPFEETVCVEHLVGPADDYDTIGRHAREIDEQRIPHLLPKGRRNVSYDTLTKFIDPVWSKAELKTLYKATLAAFASYAPRAPWQDVEGRWYRKVKHMGSKKSIPESVLKEEYANLTYMIYRVSETGEW